MMFCIWGRAGAAISSTFHCIYVSIHLYEIADNWNCLLGHIVKEYVLCMMSIKCVYDENNEFAY